MTDQPQLSLYVILNNDTGLYFAGYDAQAQAPKYVDDILRAKMHSNKYEIRLRPNEGLVELTIELDQSLNYKVSSPFRLSYKKIKK
jgi:hypothetical protein